MNKHFVVKVALVITCATAAHSSHAMFRWAAGLPLRHDRIAAAKKFIITRGPGYAAAGAVAAAVYFGQPIFRELLFKYERGNIVVAGYKDLVRREQQQAEYKAEFEKFAKALLQEKDPEKIKENDAKKVQLLELLQASERSIAATKQSLWTWCNRE